MFYKFTYTPLNSITASANACVQDFVLEHMLDFFPVRKRITSVRIIKTTMIDSIFNFSPISTASSASPAYVNPLSDYGRQNALAFHIETDDYFPFLSTLLGFVEETLATMDHSEKNLASIEIEAIRAARKDLQYLHTHCRIESRS